MSEHGEAHGRAWPEEKADASGSVRTRSRTRGVLRLLGVCAVIVLPVNAFVARPFAVPSSAMENTVRPGDRLIVNKLAYAFDGHPRRGDVVAFDGRGPPVRPMAPCLRQRGDVDRTVPRPPRGPIPPTAAGRAPAARGLTRLIAGRIRCGHD
ncbi:S26 family signal peptidase [Kitasatospora sp. NPDC015120]|uniref:S26 family signal peptidase n=1 Tax=Kitasatospora sp. NPDC015120 TaxID=3364023 RepID=UPI0036F49167